MFAFLAAGLSDRGRGPEANAIDAFPVVSQSSVNMMSGDLRVLPGRVGEISRVLTVVW
jgi:hypothetical protein